MNAKTKIGVIVVFQISLIVSSFLALYFIETQKVHLGNTINIAGLNRYLTSKTISEAYKNEINQTESNQYKSLDELENNIRILKEGGKIRGSIVQKLPIALDGELKNVENNYKEFKQILLDKGNAVEDRISKIEISGDKLIKNSDELVMSITTILQYQNELLIKLQILLLVVNTVVHILMIISIFGILNREAEEKIKLERFAIIGKIGASIAHDLRNSLTVIKGSLDILKVKNENKEEIEEKQFKKINESINQIEYLAKDILEFSRIKKLEKTQISVVELIKDAINSIEFPNEIEIKLPKNDFVIAVDKIKMQTVITNIIKNAVEAIDKKGIITIKTDNSQRESSIVISDTGMGIRLSELEHIFEPLYTTKQRGTGLGLASCQRIVNEHGGRIDVKINPTTFIIKLPKQ